MDGRPVQRLTDLQIGMNDTLFKEVNFDKGTFEILVTRNGELSDALVTLYDSGTREVAASTRTYRSADHNPARLQVLPGLYDVEIGSIEIGGKPTVRMEKQLLAGGATVSLSQPYKSGELKVGARQGAALVDATIGIYPKKGGDSVGSGRTYQSDSSNPRTFIL
jgi:hypothetical protein